MLVEQCHTRIVHFKVDQQQCVHVAGGDPILKNRHFIVAPNGETKQHRIVMLLKFGAQTGKQLHHVRFDGKQARLLGQHHADATGVRTGQCLGGAVGPPSKLLGDLQHLGSGGFGYAGLVVQCVGDCTAGDARCFGHIEYGDLVLLTSHDNLFSLNAVFVTCPGGPGENALIVNKSI